MKQKYFFILSCVTFLGMAQEKIPCEPGDQGHFWNETTDKSYTFTMTHNDPYALPKSGLDIKSDFMLSRYSGMSFGLHYFTRPDPFSEYHYSATALVFALAGTDTLRGNGVTAINYHRPIYTSDFRYIRFFRSRVYAENEYVREKADPKYSPDKRSHNAFLVKNAVQIGISGGIQASWSPGKAVTNQSVNISGNAEQPVYIERTNTYNIPFSSVVLSAGIERRSSYYWECYIDDPKDKRTDFWVSGSYIRILAAPLLTRNYVGYDKQIHSTYTLINHFGFSLGAYMDWGGPFLGDIETGIMPGIGYYFKIGWPLMQWALTRSHKNMNGTDNTYGSGY